MNLHISSIDNFSIRWGTWARRFAMAALAAVTMVLGSAATAPKAEAGVSVSIGYGYGYGYRPYYVGHRNYYTPRYYAAPRYYYAPRKRYVCRNVQVGVRYSFSRGRYVPVYQQRCWWR